MSRDLVTRAALVAAAVLLAGLAVVLFASAGDSGDDAGGGGSDHGGQGDGSLGRLSSVDGYSLEVAPQSMAARRPVPLSLVIRGPDGDPVRDFEVEHAKRLHMIVLRRDLSAFQHVHPRLDRRGVWHQQLILPAAGPYRVYADFKVDDRRMTLSTPVSAPGASQPRPLPAPRRSTSIAGGYTVRLHKAKDGQTLTFRVLKDGTPVGDLQPYLGARGHLVAIRQRDLAYLHTHPEPGGAGNGIRFVVHFPSGGRYRLFLQFRHRNRVRTAPFTFGGQAGHGGGHEGMDHGSDH